MQSNSTTKPLNQNKMEKEFVPYELAVKIKELGFNEPCLGFYNQEDRPNLGYCANGFQDDTTLEIKCTAPLYQQAFRWFREKYNWQHSIDPTADQHSHQLGYNYWIWNYKTGEEHHTMPKNRPTGDWEYKTYEEAELACLTKLIEIVETKSE